MNSFINNPKVNSKDEWSSERHSMGFLKKSDRMHHRSECENTLFDHIPKGAIRVLDLGTGDGRLLRLLKNPTTRYLCSCHGCYSYDARFSKEKILPMIPT
ncbi:MAG: hypothetical protein WKF36_09685 [Candidatus Nitrosocosmicus sp.]